MIRFNSIDSSSLHVGLNCCKIEQVRITCLRFVVQPDPVFGWIKVSPLLKAYGNEQ